MPDIYAIRVKRNNQVQVYEIYDRNARNGHFIGDVYTNADPDYTGGTKLPDENRVNALISAAISDISGISTTVVQERPAVGEPNIIYFVPHEGDDNDIYDEFMYINGSWELIGTTQVDISSKADKADTVLDTTLSMGRAENSTVGAKSTALGNNVTASGNNSQAFGASSLADGFASHAEGVSTASTGYAAHAEGQGTTASGRNAHAEGGSTTASGQWSHAEGGGSRAIENNAHAEGGGTLASGASSHSEGGGTIASGSASHAEGAITTASGSDSHAEGTGTIANHASQHVSGEYNIADPSLADSSERGNYAEIIGNGTNDDNRSNARTLDWNGNEELAGDLTVNKGTPNEVSVGALKGAIKRLVIPTFTRDMTSQNPDIYTCDMQWNEVEAAINNKTCNTCEVLFINPHGTSNDYLTLLGFGGDDSEYIEFGSVTVDGTETRNKNIKFYDDGTVEYAYSYVDLNTKADKTDTVLDTTLSRGRKNNSTVGTGSFAFGDEVRATGNYSHAEGSGTVASGAYSHAEGSYTTASFGESHAEGSGSIAGNNCAHAEGNYTTATGHAAHAEGNRTEAPGAESHSEGDSTQANGYASHSEGEGTIANANASHVGGQYNVADGYGPEWEEWTPNKLYHIGDKVKQTFDWGTSYYICSVENSDSEFIYGHWELDNDRMNYVEIIGNGTDDNNRSNARVLEWNGNEHLAGDIYVHANSDGSGGSKLPDESRVNALIATAVGGITGFDAEVVQTLPQTGTAGTIYLVPKQGSGTDVHDEYIYVNNAWELIGTTQIDISNKADKADTVLDTTLSRGRKANTTVGTGSFAFGDTVEASAKYSHAEGAGTTASGDYAHVEGQGNTASNTNAHAEGAGTTASGQNSHAEGASTNAIGHQSHAEGTGRSNQAYSRFTYSSQNEQVASVDDTVITKTGAIGVSSHSEGTYTTANAPSSHAEGYVSIASRQYSHAEGYKTNANGDASHTEGCETSTGGSYSHAEGMQAFAYGNYSHSEGYKTNAIGEASHAEGSAIKGHNDYYTASYDNQTDTKSSSYINGLPGAIGTVTHSEGMTTRAAGSYSHSEGSYTLANGTNAHSEGSNTNAKGNQSHTEGYYTVASSNQSHAEGYYTLAQGVNSHAEGDNSIAHAASSHAEGNTTKALGLYSHAEGCQTKAGGDHSHAEGYRTAAMAQDAHVEGQYSEANGGFSHAEGLYGRVNSNGYGAHSEGYGSATNKDYPQYNAPVDRTANFNGRTQPGTSINLLTGAHAQGAHNEGTYTTANANSSHAEGDSTLAQAVSSHVEGLGTIVTGGPASHAEGKYTYASGAGGAHAEGQYTMAQGSGGEHAEGMYTIATGGGGTHAEGFATHVSGGSGAHAEGYYAYGTGSFGFHIEGDHTECACGNGAHTEGYYSKSFGREGSHTEGYYTIGYGEGSHTGGRYNVPNNSNYLPDWEPNKLYHVGDRVKYLAPNQTDYNALYCRTEHTSGSEFSSLNWNYEYADNGYAEIIGNGTADDARANARALDWEGNERLAGNLYVGCNPDSTGGTKVLTENDLEYTTEADALKIISDFWNEDEEDETMIVEMVATADGYASVMDASEIASAIESGKIAMLHIPASDNSHPDAYAMLGYYAPASTAQGSSYTEPAFGFASTGAIGSYAYDITQELNYFFVDNDGKLAINYMD